MQRTSFLLFAICSTLLVGLNSNASAEIIIADAAADYVAAAGGPTATLLTPPTGWSYLASNAANGGVEVALAAGPVGNQGAAYQGFVGNSSFGTSAVYGTNTGSSGSFGIFANGGGNNPVVGSDLLMHPAQITAEEYVLARYTVSDPMASLAPGTGEVTGSFRELIVPPNLNNNNGGSVDVFVYQNDTQLFTFDTVGQDASAGSMLSQADGTFNITGLTLTDGDTIDFVVFRNGHFGADETALRAQISASTIPEPSSLALLALSGLGLFVRRRR